MNINLYENVFQKYLSKEFVDWLEIILSRFTIRGEINTSNLVGFLDETEGLLQQLKTRDKQLKEIEMKVQVSFFFL